MLHYAEAAEKKKLLLYAQLSFIWQSAKPPDHSSSFSSYYCWASNRFPLSWLASWAHNAIDSPVASLRSLETFFLDSAVVIELFLPSSLFFFKILGSHLLLLSSFFFLLFVSLTSEDVSVRILAWVGFYSRSFCPCALLSFSLIHTHW